MPPTRENSLSCNTRRILLCTCSGILTNFIEKEGTIVALLETPDALVAGTGERASQAEKFAFQEIFRNGGAVDRQEVLLLRALGNSGWPGPPVPCPSRFLARDHHRGVAARHAADHFENLLHRVGLADDLVLMLLDGKGPA